jgi:hypothetical protein
MNKSLKVERSSDKAKAGHIILTGQGWVQVKRGGRFAPWTPLDNRSKSL